MCRRKPSSGSSPTGVVEFPFVLRGRIALKGPVNSAAAASRVRSRCGEPSIAKPTMKFFTVAHCRSSRRAFFWRPFETTRDQHRHPEQARGRVTPSSRLEATTHDFLRGVIAGSSRVCHFQICETGAAFRLGREQETRAERPRKQRACRYRQPGKTARLPSQPARRFPQSQPLR